MAGTIYIASSPILSGGAAVSTGEYHLYLVYSPDGDPTGNPDALRYIEAGPDPSGNLVVTVDDTLRGTEYALDPTTLGTTTVNPFSDGNHNFTTVSTGDDAGDLWSSLVSAAQSLGPTNDLGQVIAGVPYPTVLDQPTGLGANSTSVIGTILDSQGIDLLQVLPVLGGDPALENGATPPPLTQFIGAEDIIGSPTSDNTYTVFNDNYSQPKTFHDTGGDNTIQVQLGGSVTIDETHDPNSDNTNTLNLVGLSPSDVVLGRDGNNLTVSLADPASPMSNPQVAEIDNYFAPGGNRTESLNFQDADGNSLGAPIDLSDPVATAGNYGLESPLAQLGNWMAGPMIAAWNAAMSTGSPLVLDLSTAGTGITLSAENGTGAVLWDFGDGHLHQSGFVTGTTGLLCVDPGTGVITQADLFGNEPANGIPNTVQVANGFQALAVFDSNSDGVIDASDTNFSELRVWVPSVNTDAVTAPGAGDLYTLAELGITSIDLSYSNEDYQINGNFIEQQSTFVINGNTQSIADAWFSYDPLNTIYDGSYTLNPEVLQLPDQRGYGNLPDLSIAMSMDSTLLSDVQTLASQAFPQMLDPSFGLENAIKTILYEWAGVESVDPTSQGTGVDAQHLGFVEQMMGQVLWNDSAVSSDLSGGLVEGPIALAWDIALGYLSAHLLAQTDFAYIIGSSGPYDVASDSFIGSPSLNNTAVQFADQALGGFELPHMATNDIFILFPGDSPTVAPYNSPTIFIEETPSGGGTNTLALGVAPSGVVLSDDYSGNLYVHYTSTDTVEILGDVAYSGGYHAGTIVGEYVQQIAFEDGTLWSLTGGLDLTATSTYTAVFGTATGGDTLDGSGITYADLWGYTGDETYILGPATTAVAGNGTNTYVVNADSCPASSGGASITPNASATGDQIVLHGVTESQVFLTDNSSGDLLVSTSNGDLVTVHGGSYAYGTGVTLGNIAGITLDDSTVLDLTGIVPLTPTSSGTLLGISTGTDFVANGYENNFDGFNSHDVFSFTAGSAPASSYGVNVSEYATGGTSTIAFHGLTPSEVVMTDDSYGDLIFQFGTDLVTVGGGSNTGSGIAVGNVQQATFDDSTVWNLQTGLHLTATGDYQYLYGTAGGGDTLTAAGTSDSLFAYTGAEALVAGALSSLHNGTGNDTDVFSTGFGSATVYANASGGSSNAIEFHSVTASDLVLSDDIYGQLTIQDTSTSDQILVSGGSYDSSTGFSVGNIQQIALDSSTDISLTGALNLTATGDYQSLYGTGHGDSMTALGTGDNLYGIAGNNTMTGSSSSSATTNFHGGSGNDLMIGGSGTNNMYMGTGDDEIKVEGSSSTTAVTGFDTAHDTIHLEDVMSGFDALTDALSNWVQKTESSGNTVIAVDPTGTGSFTAGPQVTLNSITGLDDIATLVAHGVVHV